MSLSYTPTVYEQIAIDLLADKELNYADYAAELQERGWDEEYYKTYVSDLKHIKKLRPLPDLKNLMRRTRDVLFNRNPYNE